MADIARPDLCIIGAGALGIALARYAKGLGADVVLVDRGRPEAGDAWQRAIALAGLQRSAEVAHLIARGEAFGLGNDLPKVRFKAVQERLAGLQDEWAPEVSRERLTALGIAVVSGPTRFTSPTTVKVGDTLLRPRKIILATGSVGTEIAIPGLEQVKVFTPDTLLENARKLTHLLVIGADPTALALGQAYRRLGSEVTIVAHGVMPHGIDAEALTILIDLLAQEGVRILQDAHVSEIEPRSQGTGVVVQRSEGKSERLDVSHILLSAGRVADVSELGLDLARIGPLGGQSRSNGVGKTGNRLVRVAGAAAGIEQWQYALGHGRAVVDTCVLGKPRRTLVSQPNLIQTDPALAQIGFMPAPGERVRRDHSIVRASFAENAAALARGQREGLIKVLVGTSGHIVGASAVGPGAAEIVSVLALALEQGITLDRLANMSLPDPSLLCVVSALGETFTASRPVSAWTARQRALRRYWPF